MRVCAATGYQPSAMANRVTDSLSSIRDQVTWFIVTSYLFGNAARTPGPDESLVETSIVDSTGVLEMIEFLESEFGINVLEEETVPSNLDSINRLCRYV